MCIFIFQWKEIWKNRCLIKNFHLQHSITNQSFPLSFSFFTHSIFIHSVKITKKILEEFSLFSGAYSKTQIKLNGCVYHVHCRFLYYCLCQFKMQIHTPHTQGNKCRRASLLSHCIIGFPKPLHPFLRSLT